MGNTFYLKQLDELRGAKVVCPAMDSSDPYETYYGLCLQFPDGRKVTIIFLRDEEGNGAGSFEINEVKE